jgi:hypothetical protein
MACIYDDHIFQTKNWNTSSENWGKLFEISSALENRCSFPCVKYSLSATTDDAKIKKEKVRSTKCHVKDIDSICSVLYREA